MDRNREHESPSTAGDGETADVARTSRAGIQRRTVLGSGLGVAATAGLLEVGLAPTASAHTEGRDCALANKSAHALYTLPEDHKWHTGGIYETGQLEEWYYWTGFLTDTVTKEEYGLFYNVFHEATAPGEFRYRVWFALYNLDKNEYVWAVQNMEVPLTATAPHGRHSRNSFQYSAHTDNTRFKTTYHARHNIWSLQMSTVGSNVAEPINLDLRLRTRDPYGYIPMTPYGLENENQPWTGVPDPATMYSLSYYYGGPKTDITGTVTTGAKVHHLEGSLWFEHQWGNFSVATQPWGSAYIWSALQFNDGPIFTFRQWYNEALKPLLNLGRHSYSTPTNGTIYGFGESVEFTPLQTWHSPVSNRNFPVYGRLSTEFGTWYYSPVFPNYEIPFGYPPYGTSNLDIWEAPCLLHTGSLTGPVVGMAFLELPNVLTASFPALP